MHGQPVLKRINHWAAQLWKKIMMTIILAKLNSRLFNGKAKKKKITIKMCLFVHP